MVMKRIIYKVLNKTRWNRKVAEKEMATLKKLGFDKNTFSVTDYKTIGKGSKMKGVGMKILAWKGHRKVPVGYRTKLEEY